MPQPEIALLLSTFERPRHLTRALESIAAQEGVAGKIELIVTDDGSRDETPRIVEQFARSAPFRVAFTTHPHQGFRLSRCRNDGVKASTAPYVLFLDGDCVFPRDHVQVHLARRKPATVMGGDSCRLEERASEQVTSEMIQTGDFERLAAEPELRRLRKLEISSRFYNFIRHPIKPKLFGNNIGIWRSDFERVNGYDENFQGWGCEDDDLRNRLRSAGVRVETILRWTRAYHLWHQVHPTQPPTWKQGNNVGYLQRKGRLTRCRNGLAKRSLQDLVIRIIGRPAKPQVAARLIEGRIQSTPTTTPEVEILFLPGEGRFSGRAECNVLVAMEPAAARSRRARQADMMIAPTVTGSQQREETFPFEQFERALGAVA